MTTFPIPALGEVKALLPDDLVCARCEGELSTESQDITIAMTSKVDALLFHGSCMRRMHSLAVKVIDGDGEVRKLAADAWQRKAEEVADGG